MEALIIRYLPHRTVLRVKRMVFRTDKNHAPAPKKSLGCVLSLSVFLETLANRFLIISNFTHCLQ